MDRVAGMLWWSGNGSEEEVLRSICLHGVELSITDVLHPVVTSLY